MPRGTALCSIAVMAILLLSSLTAGGAGDERGTEFLLEGEHVGVRVDNSEGGDIDLRYFVAVIEGPSIDIFFMDEEAYEAYESGGEGDYYVDYSTLDTKDVDRKFVWDVKGVFYVVVDNTISATPPPVDPEAQNATVVYVVTWDPVDDSDWLRSSFFFFIALFLVIFAAVMVGTLMKRRR